MEHPYELHLVKSLAPGGGVLPYLGMVGRFRGDDPVFGISNPIGSLFYTSAQSDWPPLSAEKNQFVSITFSSRDTGT